jgi:epoxyqueuosine reductase QueG
MATPHGFQPDLRSNRFAALASGLGSLTTSGHIATKDFGLKQRFIAIVTDAQLEEDPILNPQDFDLCKTCEEKCVKACPVAAFNSEYISFTLEGNSYSFINVDQQRCDWSQRYGLVKDSGFKYVGSQTDEYPDKEITGDSLASALKKLHPIGKHRPVIAQPCVMNCPYMRTND